MKPFAWLACPFVLLLLTTAHLAGQDSHPLEPGTPMAHTLGSGEVRAYELQLESDWFVSGRVGQEGVAVTVAVIGPDGEELQRFAAPLGKGAPMAFQFSSDDPGVYRVEVAARSEGDEGSYRIQLDRFEPVADTPEGRIDQAMAMFQDDTPGGVVAVIRQGEVDVLRTYGSANLAYGIPFSGDTPTNIGSTSKQFTGFALALLQARGEISLDDDVRSYIPELKEFDETVTLRHLMSHTTGYREYINTLLLSGRQVLESDHIDRDEVVAVVNRQPRLQNVPGTEFNYNNTAFSLATLVVERVTGHSFPEWMEDEVFEPLGMHHTLVRADPGQVIPNRAEGYSPTEVGFRETRDLGSSMGAGGIYTTPGDLALWMGNLATGTLGGPEVIRTLTTPYVLANGDTTNYGLGLFIDEQEGLTRWQHGGSDIAHRSTFVYYPELDAGYVVLSNYAALPGGVGSVVADAFFGEHMERADAGEAESPADGIHLSDALLEAYAGRYELSGMVIEISVAEEGLQFQLTGQPSTALRATSDTTFTVDGVDARVTFHADEDGPASALTLHQAGDHRASRISATDKTPANLDEYAGRYFSEELETYYQLVVEEEQLVIRHRRFGPALLTHVEGDRFSGALPVTEMEFGRNEGGDITGFHGGNGRTLDVWFERVGG